MTLLNLSRYQPRRPEFLRRCEKGNLVPVYRTFLADLDTPLSAFFKIRHDEYAFLLESVEQEEKLGRFSFLGCDPKIVFKARGQEVEILHRAQNRVERKTSANPLHLLRELMRPYQLVVDPELPPFVGGAVGYLGYDAIRYFERIPDANTDDLQLPELYFVLTDTFIIFDHVRHLMTVVANAFVEDNAEDAYEDAIERIERMRERLVHAPEPEPPSLSPASLTQMESNFKQAEFEKAVERAKEYIFAGDIFQVVLSQRFHSRISVDDLHIYRALRAINPSPYMFYLKFGDLRLIGSSPEILVKVVGDEVSLRPIAGTRPRGKTRPEDQALARELLDDPKECAEHIMLVDLGRNDCGRVSRFGSVHVDELMVIERYSHVMHIVSNVVGKLHPDYDCFDVLQASFPAGTVTGAPKIRAMEIIDELENLRRGPYAGAVGYFSYSGNLDTCITIRTIVIKGNDAYVQVGAGIVADSVPAREFQETVNKAKGLLNALDLAHRGLR